MANIVKRISPKPITSMKLTDWCALHDLEVLVFDRGTDRMEGVERYYATFNPQVQVVRGQTLIGSYGNGKNFTEAIADLKREFSGKTVRINETESAEVPELK